MAHGRREPRYPVTMPLRWREGDQAWRSGLSRDLSPRGLFILTGGVPRPGTRLDVEINSPAGPIGVRAIVRWTRSEEGPGSPRGMGVELIHPSEAQRVAWDHLVERSAEQVESSLKAGPRPATTGGVRLANRTPPQPEPMVRKGFVVVVLVAGMAAGWLLKTVLGG